MRRWVEDRAIGLAIGFGSALALFDPDPGGPATAEGDSSKSTEAFLEIRNLAIMAMFADDVLLRTPC